jgi:hypothetical protein
MDFCSAEMLNKSPFTFRDLTVGLVVQFLQVLWESRAEKSAVDSHPRRDELQGGRLLVLQQNGFLAHCHRSALGDGVLDPAQIQVVDIF